MDDIGILAERRAERHGNPCVSLCTSRWFTISLVRVDVLDRILNGEDVLPPLGVDLVDHRRQSRRLAAARRSRDQDQAAGTIGQRREHGWQPELGESFDLLRDDAVDRRDRAPLVEDVAAEARETADAERKIELQRFLEALLLHVGKHAVGKPLGFGGPERRQIKRLQLAVNTNLGRRLRRQMQIGSAQVDESL